MTEENDAVVGGRLIFGWRPVTANLLDKPEVDVTATEVKRISRLRKHLPVRLIGGLHVTTIEALEACKSSFRALVE